MTLFLRPAPALKNVYFVSAFPQCRMSGCAPISHLQRHENLSNFLGPFTELIFVEKKGSKI
jgi:hypothetical protein